MAKNIMEKVAKMLGVKLEEEFNLRKMGTGKLLKYYEKNEVYKFTNNGLITFLPYGQEWRQANLLREILTGEYEIVKLPWRPKKGEWYFYPYNTIMNNNIITPCSRRWGDELDEYAFLALGMVYRTEEECKKHIKEDYKKLTGKEWKE